MPTDADAAKAVTEYLMHSTYRGDVPPLERLVREKIGHLARTIAYEIVESTPDLRDAIETQTREAVRRALANDEFLRKTVVTSVAEALTTRLPDEGET